MNILWVFLAVFFLVAGLLLLPLPFPVGLPLMLVGLVILLKKSPITKRFMRSLRGKYRSLDGFLIKLEKNLPRMAASLLKRTRPFASRKKKPRILKK